MLSNKYVCFLLIYNLMDIETQTVGKEDERQRKRLLMISTSFLPVSSLLLFLKMRHSEDDGPRGRALKSLGTKPETYSFLRLRMCLKKRTFLAYRLMVFQPRHHPTRFRFFHIFSNFFFYSFFCICEVGDIAYSEYSIYVYFIGNLL